MRMTSAIDQPPADWPLLFRRWGRAILDRDLDAFRNLLAPDVVVEAADGSVHHGVQVWLDVRAGFYDILGGDGQQIDQWFAEPPGTYGWRWRQAGISRDGNPFDLTGCTICEFNGELVVRVTSYVDTEKLAVIARSR